MKFIIDREKLLKPLQQVSAPLSSRPTLPILGNLLLQVSDNTLSMTGTDLEIEMIARLPLIESNEPGSTTVPARKFFDICRSLPGDAQISITLDETRLLIQSGRSKFSLSTLPAADFPNLENWQSEVEFYIPQKALKHLIDAVQFSMANQDVRYYLNGMLFETEGDLLRTVATDGHRLAVCSLSVGQTIPSNQSVIMPRKGVLELVKLLGDNEDLIHIQIGSNSLRANLTDFTFTSKLIDGRFPDYRRVLPRNPDKTLQASCETLKSAFSRAAILSNEKFRGVRLYVNNNQLKITANNPEQEEAEEIVDVNYSATELEIGFNVNYILDVLNVLKCEEVQLLLTDSTSSVQIEDVKDQSATYVIMPMRL
ncbi:DNA polymerase III subunit beta [Zophobihabitans entericus]|uniref:Beta sliding clamp n=1 Tax=Zophobihabitans entericus TaxID=1635327 RepID=A0A6G9I7M5_9GAMM|nr:DNA polymerase III subunit beta [Zophobihabitans entericus]QIQ20205.1 DNA polymerase III subunit beta [Zophobihabitans entericus]